MKAVLVMPKMPESCWECQFVITTGKDAFHPEGYFCFLHGAKDSVGGCEFKRADFCPLCPMPEEIPSRDGMIKDEFKDGYGEGWNDAIKTIEGSGEDGA